jgi:hypothetical protein
VAAALAVCGVANAVLSITPLGTGAPPTVYFKPDGSGPFGLIAAPLNPAPVFADVTSAPLDRDKNVLFSIPLSHRTIGFGWATWSHGYTGDVYYTNGATAVTMSFDQDDMQAFYFYAEPNPFGLFDFTVTATSSDGHTSTVTALIEGSAGAQGFLIATDGLRKLGTITVSSSVDFAIGEFGYAKTIPVPGALALLGLAGLAGRRRRA